MKNNIPIKFTLLITALSLSFACKNKPKVIESPIESVKHEKTSGIFGNDSSHADHTHTHTSSASIGENMHTVVAMETLTTDKYIYILVKEEGQEDFWIATTKQEIVLGNVYFFRDGLLKTNFESREHKKTFEKIFFVSKLVPFDHGNTSSGNVGSNTEMSSNTKIKRKGSVKISDLVSNPNKYSGKIIQVSGECTKINLNIMGRNWIHLRDGSAKNVEIVITSSEIVQVGQTFSMSGIVVLDKDFGSGYQYDILLENGVLVK
ncbi:MAG TPA: hypothetical protein PKM97_02485 [Bacteroidia bacterium]|nr:hypothetical protein [Bacteroidia bacterium]